MFASRTETQGLVLLEAMAQGVPVVSTAELGTRDVLREGLGVHIAQEDVADFSAKVIRLLDDGALRETLGASGRGTRTGGRPAGWHCACWRSTSRCWPRAACARSGWPCGGRDPPAAALSRAPAQPGLRFTSTMPAATRASAASKLGVTGSFSHSAPNSSAKIGVRNTNTEIFVAG